jgi:hypothetical protein
MFLKMRSIFLLQINQPQNQRILESQICHSLRTVDSQQLIGEIARLQDC